VPSGQGVEGGGVRGLRGMRCALMLTLDAVAGHNVAELIKARLVLDTSAHCEGV
jgi:hypothetical protein